MRRSERAVEPRTVRGKPVETPHYENNGIEKPRGGQRTGSGTGAGDAIGTGRTCRGLGMLRL